MIADRKTTIVRNHDRNHKFFTFTYSTFLNCIRCLKSYCQLKKEAFQTLSHKTIAHYRHLPKGHNCGHDNGQENDHLSAIMTAITKSTHFAWRMNPQSEPTRICRDKNIPGMLVPGILR